MTHDQYVVTLETENARLKELLHLYRCAVRIHPTMEAPRFGGCNLSDLLRAWDEDRKDLISTDVSRK